jgi:hypothetical protein
VRKNIASSSASLRDCGPFLSSFYIGRSLIGQSDIAMITSLFFYRIVNYSFNCRAIRCVKYS